MLQVPGTAQLPFAAFTLPEPAWHALLTPHPVASRHRYVAPEVLAQEVTRGQLRQYGTSCDMWSVGVIVYMYARSRTRAKLRTRALVDPCFVPRVLQPPLRRASLLW